VQLVIGLLETSTFTRAHEPKHKNEPEYEQSRRIFRRNNGEILELVEKSGK